MGSGTHLLTYATHETEGLRVWRSGAQRHGWRPTVVGLGAPWRGWKARAAALATAVARLDPGDLVLVTDAYDVCVTNSPTALREVVGAKAVLVGTERTARRLVARLPLHPSGKVNAGRARERDFGFSARLHEDSPGLTINCGAFAGRAAPLAAVLRSVAVSPYGDDQAAWGAIADGDAEAPGLGASEVAFDTESRLVCNLSIGSVPELLSFALLPHQHVRARVREALASGVVCVHAPGSPLDGGVRYALLLSELGHATGSSVWRASVLSAISFLLLALALGVVLRVSLAQPALHHSH